MKTKQLLLLLLVSISTLTVSAYDLAVENADGKTIYYNLINNNTELEVTYHDINGEIKYTGDINIPEIVGYDGSIYSVTRISDRAFIKCDDLTTVTIPNSVTSIGDYAFYDSYGLTSVTMSNNLTTIGYAAFYYCRNLTEIAIPASVETIETAAFAGCSKVASITVDANNKNYDSRNNCNAIIDTQTDILISGCINTVIPDGIVAIADFAFMDVIIFDGKSLTIPNSVKTIGKSSFYQCWLNIKLGEGIETIGDYAFWNCGMTEIVIPNSVREIGEFAFEYQQRATRIYIGSGVEKIGRSAFVECLKATSIVVDADNSHYDSRNNCNALIETGTNTLLAGCNYTVIPDDIEAFGDYAMSMCSEIKTVTISDKVRHIGVGAFNRCQSLEIVTSYSFEPFDINDNVFYVYDEDTDSDIFTSATLYVPTGTTEKYRAALGWKNFKEIIEFTPASIENAAMQLNDDAPIYNINGQRVDKNYKGIAIQNGCKYVAR